VGRAGADTTTVRTAGGVEVVDTSLVEPLHPGDLVLVHAGVAISCLEGQR
jgi:hydrogenase maturation factor